MEKIYGMHKVVGLQLFWSGTPTFSSGTPTFCQMGVLNSCFQNPSESSGFNLKVSACVLIWLHTVYMTCVFWFDLNVVSDEDIIGRVLPLMTRTDLEKLGIK